MFKFLPGILLIQLISAGLVFIAINWSLEPQLIIVLAAFSLIIAILSMFWFASIAHNINSTAHSKLEAKHAKEREKILLKAEREKAKVISTSQQRIKQSSKKIVAKANFKVGAAVAAAVGIGGLMIISQLVTVGLMLLVASGSGLAGYLTRARQESLQEKKQASLPKKILPGIKKSKLKTIESSQ